MKFCALLALLALVMLAGCAPKKAPVTEAAPERYPFDVDAEVDDGMMIVTWKTAGEGIISGYNIYISEEPLLTENDSLAPAIEPHNTTTYAGDTDPDDGIEHYEARGLENGVLYYVHVRIVYPDRSLSPPTEEVRAVCGPRGEIELAVRYQDKPDGFSFVRDEYVDADNVANDVYYYTRDGNDYLVSPSELGGLLRVNRFRVLDMSGTLDHVSEQLPLLSSQPTARRVEISEGDWVWIMTSEEQHALLKVQGFTGSVENRKVQLFYAFTPRAGSPIF
jgi:hypothetical protein